MVMIGSRIGESVATPGAGTSSEAKKASQNVSDETAHAGRGRAAVKRGKTALEVRTLSGQAAKWAPVKD
jgi:hypothetical protein